MSERETPTGAGENGEAGGGPGKPYAEMTGMNAEIARQRSEEEAAAAAGSPEPAPERASEPVAVAAAAAAAKPEAAKPAPTPPTSRPVPARAAAGGGGAGGGGAGGGAGGGSGGGAGGSAGGGGRSLTLVLLAVLVGGLAALLARPYLPEPVAAYLSPGDAALQGEVESLRRQVARLDEVEEELASMRQTAGEVGEVQDALSAVESRIEEIVAAKLGILEDNEADDLTKEGIKIALAEIWSRVEALESSEAAETEELESKLSELGAKVTALEAAEQEIDGIASRLAEIEEKAGAAMAKEIAAVASRIDALEGDLADAQQRALKAEAVAEAQADAAAEARARGQLRASAAELKLDLRTGAPFAEVLARLEREAGVRAPGELRDAADGLVSTDALEKAFPGRAQEAVKADVMAQESDDTTLGQASAWFKAQVTGRPVGAREGDDVPSVLSRIGVAVEAGDAVAAYREAETLPDHAKEALGPWLDQLRTRAEAEAALDRWLAEIGATDS